jgi:hypothetical protein
VGAVVEVIFLSALCILPFAFSVLFPPEADKLPRLTERLLAGIVISKLSFGKLKDR